MIAFSEQTRTLPEAWESSIITLLRYGDEYCGRHWRRDMPIGRTCMMTLVATQWNEEPCIHRGFTCDPQDLLAYGLEIVDGTDRGWEYTYHDRIFAYGPSRINQYDYALHCLARKQNSNKAVITLGDPSIDAIRDGDGTHIPCLREIKWSVEGEALDTCLFWRSRDAINAAFPNLFGLLQLTRRAATELSEIMSRRIRVGRLIDISHNYHINGAHMELARRVMDLRHRPIEERTWTTDEVRDYCHG